MLKTKYCAECGAEIIVQYIIPSKSFRIEKGELVRDDAWHGAGYDDPYFEYKCSNDSEHDIDPEEYLLDWMVEVEYKFKKEGKYNE